MAGGGSSAVVYRGSRGGLQPDAAPVAATAAAGGVPKSARGVWIMSGLATAALLLLAHVLGALDLGLGQAAGWAAPLAPLTAVGATRGGAPPGADPDQQARQPFAPPPRDLGVRGAEGARWFQPDHDWRNRTGSDLTTCVIVRTYVAQRNMLMALLGSLAAARHPGLFTVLVDTGKAEPFAELPALAALFNELSERPHGVSVSRWAYHNSRALYPALSVEDYGYVATDLALEDALYGSWPLGADGLPLLQCDTFVVTNGDNLYTAAFFEATLRAASVGRYDMIGTHWVSHYNWNSPVWDTRTPEQLQANKHCGSLRSGTDMEMWAAHDFHVACIDLGAVLWRRWLIEATGSRFVLDALASNGTGRHFDFFTADGWFFQRAHRRPAARSLIIRESLMIHQ